LTQETRTKKRSEIQIQKKKIAGGELGGRGNTLKGTMRGKKVGLLGKVQSGKKMGCQVFHR